ncbi:unnamed protein product [Polarella glacialis]|uniref:Uncharacterized protein n=1 Tax=Polarella glacialis TaxID=89957 RepID=A0A813DC16_POLGL|nr:unnamed protein product [Polarella glacialis]CAE8649386.1 unnamed protein product [Polarella glacialis]
MARLVLAVVSVIMASVVGNDVSFQEDSMPTDDAILVDPNHEDCGLSLRQLRGTKLQADGEEEEAADNEEVQVETKGALAKATDMDGDAILDQVNAVRGKQVNGIMGGEIKKNVTGLPMSAADKALLPVNHCTGGYCFGACMDEPFGGRTKETECNPAKEACGPVYCASHWCYGICR